MRDLVRQAGEIRTGSDGVRERQHHRLPNVPRRARRKERDGGGQLLARAPLRPSDAAGGDIALTIDLGMQAAAEEALHEAIEQSGARGGSIITLDPATGEVLALAQAPPFDPNQFVGESGAPQQVGLSVSVSF